MAKTSELRKVDEYIFNMMKDKYGEVLKRKRLQLNDDGFSREFSGVSINSKIVVQICHSSGLTKSGNIPSAKLDRTLMRCLLLDRTSAERKIVIFTNSEFKEIFKKKCGSLFNKFEFILFNDFPNEYQIIIDSMIEESSNENG